MEQKKELSIFDPEQVDLIANLFADIIERPSKDWTIESNGPIDSDSYHVRGKFTLVEDIPPRGDKDIITISASFFQKAKLDIRGHKFDASNLPDFLVIRVDNLKEYICRFDDEYLQSIPGIKRLQQVLHKKALELLQQLLDDTKLEGKNLVGMLKAVKKEQK